jgi:hypothetical protein
VLVPMFGMGLNGLWSAYHGVFPPLTSPDLDFGATSGGPIDKNEEHG